MRGPAGSHRSRGWCRPTPPGPGPSGAVDAFGLSLDHDGTVVGTVWDGATNLAVVLEPGSTELEDLGTLEGGTSSATAVSGDTIVGSVDIDGLSRVARFTALP